MKKKIFYYILLLLFTTVNGFAQSGADDPTFNPADIVLGSGEGAYDQGFPAQVNSAVLQSDGKIIIGGSFTSYNGVARNHIARINPDGTLDATFNTDATYNEIHSINIQSDGKFIITGFAGVNGLGYINITRLNVNGLLDPTFNPGGGLVNYASIYSAAIQNDGKIIIGGDFSDYNGVSINGIARINTDGSLDTTFNPGTGVSDVLSITIQSDNKIIIGGQFEEYDGVPKNYTARINTDGSLDTTYDPGTGGSFSSVNCTAVQSDGKILIGGWFYNYNDSILNNIARVNPDGSLDTTFNAGTGADDRVNSLVIQSDGKILIGGWFDWFDTTAIKGIARINTDGTLDTSFNPGTGVGGQVNSLIMVNNGKIIMAGNIQSYNGFSRNGITRAFSDGTFDATFNSRSGADGNINTTAVQNDGKIIITGGFGSYSDIKRNGIARLDIDGILEAGFDPGIGANGNIYSTAVQNDGKIIIGGSFNSYDNIPVNRIARLNPDGSLDTAFNYGNSGISGNGGITSIVIQSDGKIIIGGDFYDCNGTGRNGIARLNTDGTLDTSFDPGTGINNLFSSESVTITIQSDGKIIIVGAFTTYNGIGRNRIARINPDGTLDVTFNPGSGANGKIKVIALQSDGKIIISGDFTSYNFTGAWHIAQLNSDGTLNTNNWINFWQGANNTINSITIQSDDKIIIAGNFTAYMGTATNRIARLNPDLTFDFTFNTGTGANQEILTTVIQSGKIIIGGNFNIYNGIGRHSITRIHSRYVSCSVTKFDFCTPANVNVNYTVSENFNNNNTFTAQLSDSSGSFSNAINIGSIGSITSGSIGAVIPANIPSGSSYRIRVVSSDPVITGTANEVNLRIKLSASSNAPVCVGSTLNLIALAVADSGVTPTFTWTGPNSFSSSLQNPVISNVAAADSGTYTVTDNSSCSSSVSVSVVTSPVATINSNSPVCDGEVLMLSAAGGDAYSWTGPNGFSANGSNTSKAGFTLADTGTYIVTIHLNSCPDSTVISTYVSLMPKPVVSISGLSGAYCLNGPPCILSGLPSGGIFTGTGMSSNIFTPSLAGQHVIKYFSPPFSGCPVDSVVQTTTVNTLPSVTISSSAGTVLCPGSSTVLNATSSTPGFLWNTGSTASNISVNAPGSYMVTVTDSNNCTAGSNSVNISLDNIPHIVSSNGTSLCPGESTTLSFNTGSLLWSTGATTSSIVVSPSAFTVIYVQGTSVNGCSYNDSIHITVNPPVSPGPVTNMLPADSSVNLLLPLTLTWFPGAYNTKYDIYIWPDNEPQPVTPFVGNFAGINLAISGLNYGGSYNWSVVSKNGNCFSTNGPVHHFTITQLPNLVAQNLQFPPSAVAGQNITLSWEVQNTGNAATGSQQWSDAIFISADTILDFQDALFNGGNLVGSDSYISGVPSFSALLTGQSYSNSISYNLPINAAGTYYVFVIANAFHQLNEADTTITDNWTTLSNNIIRSYSQITVSIPPLPDLRVTSIVNQNNAFSGDTIHVTYTVKNFGTGSTGFHSWNDKVFITDQPFLDINLTPVSPNGNWCGDLLNQYIGFNGNLLPDSSYTHTITIPLPENVFGTFFIFIVTDMPNSVYESLFENNNQNSNPIQVFLTPPADLIVPYTITPASANSGQEINIVWQVKNQGLSPTNQLINGPPEALWQDEIYVTQDSSYDLSGAIKVYDTTYFGGGNFVNSNGQPISLCDLLMFMEENIVFVVSYEQQWQQALQQGNFSYAAHLYDLYQFYSDNYTFLYKQYKSVIQKLDPQEYYNGSASIIIPEYISGNYYFYIKADASNNIFEYNNEGNNILRSDMVTISKPDLQVANVTAPSLAEAGAPVSIQWQVNNPGNGGIINHIRKDCIFLCTGNVFNLANAVAIDSIEYTESVPAGATLNKQKTVTLPYTLSGTYHVFVFTDFRNVIFETNENNNVNTSAPVIQINLTTWADLSVSVFNPSDDTLQTVVSFPLTYSVTNSGTRQANGSWTDSLFISKKAFWNRDSSYFIGAFPQTRFLASPGSYTANSQLSLPLTQYIPNGTDSSFYFFYLLTDAGNTVFENTGEGNNIYKSPAVFIYDKPVDHIVTTVAGADSAVSGALYSLQWSVKNAGSLVNTAYYNSWSDDFYLSADTILNPLDILFGTKYLSSPLSQNTSYTNQQGFSMPNGVSGDFYLIASTALVNQIPGEKNRTNNTNLIRDIGGVPKTVHINATPPPDLKVVSVNAPSTGISGQPIYVKFTVKNDGPGATNPNLWQDVVFLSTDFIPANGDAILKINQASGGLNPGASYTDSVQVFLPIQANGNYVVIVNTDNTNAVYDADNSNNSGFALINIIQPQPCDLSISGITAPDSAVAGDSVKVKWQLANNSLNAATGFTKAAVYFSKDALWDINDPFLGIVTRTINIAPGSSATDSLTAVLTSTAIGYHHVLVRADLLDNIYESNENNNISASSEQVFVTVKNLPLNVVTPDVLVNNTFLYYKFDAPDSLSGETLLVTLKGDSINGVNEIYGSFNEVPTRSSFDFSFSNPVSGNQELVIPALVSGTYYFAVYGHSITPSQNVTLLAQILPFEIRLVDASKGGNTGNVTIKITGSKFTPSMQAHLLSNSSALDISASNVSYVNSTTVFATFSLNQKPLGIYDLKLVKPDSTEGLLDNGFEIEAGNTGTFYVGGISNSGMTGDPNAPGCDPGAEAGINQSLQLSVNAPVYVNLGRIIPMQISFGNAGNVDIPVPTRILICSRKFPLAFDVPSLAQNKEELYIEFEEPGGPPGILRAGASGTITVFSKAVSVGAHTKATFTLK